MRKEKIFNRRKFLNQTSKTAMLSLLSTGVLNNTIQLKGVKKERDNRFIAGPFLQHLSSDQCTIVWITKERSFSWLEYGDGHFLHQKAYHTEDGLITANNHLNKITIKRLKPDTTYKYRILSAAIKDFKAGRVDFAPQLQSDTYTFKTPAINEEKIKWVVMNDIHDNPQTIPELLYRYGTDENKPNYDLVVFNGDSFSAVYNKDQIIDHLLTPCKNVFAKNIPFYFGRGNHETRGPFARRLKNYFFYPEGRYYTAFSRGPVRFIFLDSGEDKTDDNWEYSGLASFDHYREKEARWLEQEIEKDEFKKAPFRVAIMHIPPYYSGDWHGTMEVRRLFAPLLNKGKVDLLIGAHRHRYGVYDPDNETHHYPIVIGGGPRPGTRTLIKAEANMKNLRLKVLLDDGREVGEYNLSAKR